MNIFQKTLAIMLASLFIMSLTSGAVSAISPKPEPPAMPAHTVLVKSSAFPIASADNLKFVKKAPLITFKIQNGLKTTNVNIIGLVLD
jgi:hypothetical protein